MADRLDGTTDRRGLLRLGLAGVAAAAVIASPRHAIAHPGPTDLSLNFLNLHTGETVRSVFFADGRFVPDGLREINHVLRDHRTEEIATIDPSLLLLVHRLRATVESQGAVRIISGYRSPVTNARLRQASGGVAKGSYHMRGMAIDLSIDGVDLRDVRRAALALKAGGVGYYPGPGFVHVDTGPVRAWG